MATLLSGVTFAQELDPQTLHGRLAGLDPASPWSVAIHARVRVPDQPTGDDLRIDVEPDGTFALTVPGEALPSGASVRLALDDPAYVPKTVTIERASLSDLTPDRPHVILIERAVRLRGRLVGPDDEPLAQGRVRIARIAQGPLTQDAFAIDCAEDGAFDARVPRLGTAALVACDTVQGSFEFHWVSLTRLSPDLRGIHRTIELGPDEVTDVGTITLQNSDAAHGIVRDPTGAPLADARLVAVSTAGDPRVVLHHDQLCLRRDGTLSPAGRVVLADDAGRFDARGLTSPDYEWSLESSGFRSDPLERSWTKDGLVLTADIAFVRIQAHAGRSFFVGAGPADGSRPTRWSHEVSSEVTLPLTARDVSSLSVTSQGYAWESRLLGTPSGTHEWPITLRTATPQAVRLRLTPAEHATDLTMLWTAPTVRGSLIVLDRDPIEQADLRVFPRVLPGRYVAHPRPLELHDHDHRLLTPISLEIKGDDVQDITLEIKMGGRLRVDARDALGSVPGPILLLDDTGRPVPFDRLSVIKRRNHTRPSLSQPIPPGRYEVIWNPQGVEMRRAHADVRVGEITDVRFDLSVRTRTREK